MVPSYPHIVQGMSLSPVVVQHVLFVYRLVFNSIILIASGDIRTFTLFWYIIISHLFSCSSPWVSNLIIISLYR